MKSIAIAVLLLCVSCSGLDPQRIAAERATYDWFAPLTRRYLEQDPSLDVAARTTHLRGLDAWRARLEAQEQLAGLVVVR